MYIFIHNTLLSKITNKLDDKMPGAENGHYRENENNLIVLLQLSSANMSLAC